MKTFKIVNHHGEAVLRIDDKANDVLEILMDWDLLWSSENRKLENIGEVIFKNIYMHKSTGWIPIQARIICFPDFEGESSQPKIEFEHQIKKNAEFFLFELNYVIPILNKFKNEIVDTAICEPAPSPKMKKGKANAEKK